jgi:HSP20 family molecular chaperone IbpA
MTRVPLFNSPLLLGFENFERTLDRISKHATDNYPPYNIEQIGDDALRITLAVAGFSAGDLEVQLEDNQLVIRGRQPEDGERNYLHRGIAARQFQRSFVLAEGLEVAGATLEHGLLAVDLLRPTPVSKARRIEIRQAGGARAEKDGEVSPDGAARVPRGGRPASTN